MAGRSHSRSKLRESLPELSSSRSTNPGGHSSRPVQEQRHLSAGRCADANQHYDFPVAVHRCDPGLFRAPCERSRRRRHRVAAMEALVTQSDEDKEAIDLVSTRSDVERHAAHDLCRNHARAADTPTTPCPSAPRPTSIAASSPARASSSEREARGAGGRSRSRASRLSISAAKCAKPAPPLTPEILGPVETMVAKLWPGVPMVPTMSAGATDGAFLSPGHSRPTACPACSAIPTATACMA